MHENGLNIVVFAYKRPDSLERCLAALQENKLSGISKLVICIDGPKENALENDINGFKKTVEVAKNIQGFAEVNVWANKTNLGLVQQFFLKFDALFELADEWVVVEDDIIVGHFFLDYMQEAFRRFGQNTKVSLIHAYTYYISTFKKENSCFFAVGSGNKAFGITKTFWKNLERKASYYAEMPGNHLLKEELIKKKINYSSLNIEELRSDKLKAWDVILSMYTKREKLLCLSPDFTLAKDAGWNRTDASNTFGENVYDTGEFDADYRIKIFPSEVAADKRKEKQIKFYFKYTLRLKFLESRIKKNLKRLKPSR